MRVAVVDVSGTAVRSVIADAADGRVRRIRDHTLAVGVGRAVRQGDVVRTGMPDLLLETARRFHQAHVQAQVDQAWLTVDSDVRASLDDAGVVRRVAQVLDAEVLPSHPDRDMGALVAAARGSGALDGRPTVLVEFADGRARSVVADRDTVSAAVDVRLPSLAGLGTVAQPSMGDRWLDVAVAAVAPVLEALPSARSLRPILAAGHPVRRLAALVVARQWRHPLRTFDRVSIAAAEMVDLAAELSGSTTAPRPTLPGVEGDDVHTLSGTAVALAGLMAATGAGAVLTTDAQRLDGHLALVLGCHRPRSLADALLEAAGPPTAHARQVADLAARLFDGLREVHGLAASDREVLHVGALLRDPSPSGGSAHHRRGAERLLGLAIPGVDPGSLVEVACLVRSHHGRPPGSHVPLFERLPEARRDVVRRLVAILRLADGLDRTDDVVARVLAGA